MSIITLLLQLCLCGMLVPMSVKFFLRLGVHPMAGFHCQVLLSVDYLRSPGWIISKVINLKWLHIFYFLLHFIPEDVKPNNFCLKRLLVRCLVWIVTKWLFCDQITGGGGWPADISFFFFIFLLVGLKEACMPNFSFLGSFLQLFHYYSGWVAGGRAAGWV
jgi:hypothetical protein